MALLEANVVFVVVDIVVNVVVVVPVGVVVLFVVADHIIFSGGQ